MSSQARPAYGRRLMPAVLDQLAAETPDRLYAAIPKTTDVEQGFRDVTVADMARSADFMAHWIEQRFGRSQSFETLSFIGIPDLRGAVIFLAAVKCGYKLLLPSPRNPGSTNISLMDQTESTKLLHAAEVAPIVQQLQALKPTTRTEVVPSFEEMLTSSPVHVAFEKDFDAARNEPVVVLHSSGSTGLPKPITMTHGSFAVLDNEHNLPDVPGRKKRDWSMWTFAGEARVYTVFPFFHLAGFLSLTLQTIFMNASPVLGPPHLIPDGPLLKSVMLHQKLRSIFLPPAIIEQLLHEPNGIDFFKDLDFLAYSGAPFNPEIGDQLSKFVDLVSPFGSTEVYPQPELAPSREDWAWHEFNPNVKHDMRVYDSSEGTYELVILVDEAAKDTAAAYHNMPGVKEYYTKDLFTRHPDPSKSSLYKYYGRRDDIIVLANGEKFNPVPLEVSVQNFPALKGAFLIGNGRNQAALLVEPKEPHPEEADRQKLVESLWPLVEKSNSLIAGQGRIHRNKILCAVPEKPFTRTGKGTIVRKLTQESYSDEIDKLYSSAAVRSQAVSLEPVVKAVYELPTVMEFVRNIMSASLPKITDIAENDDLFAHGLDSIQTLEIVSSLKQNLQPRTTKSVAWISPRTIFGHPTVAELSSIICDFLNDSQAPEGDPDLIKIRAVNEAVDKYAKDLPPKASRGAKTLSDTGLTVALIGSTGYLGSHLLAKLAKDAQVSRIWCLNRGQDAEKRQQASLAEISANAGDISAKLSYATIEIGKPALGLSQEAYRTLSQEADILIYNAWRLDFGLAVRSFDPFLRATRHLVDLAAGSARGAKIVFVSSLSSVGRLALESKATETAVADPLAAIDIGYGQSKLVAERILTAASVVSGVPVTVVRIGQVGGPSTVEGQHGGKWADQPWLSALVRTAKDLGTMPAKVAAIDWVPVDCVASMLRDFALHNDSATGEGQQAQFYHICHPSPQPWDLLVRVVSKRQTVRTIPLPEWVKQLRVLMEQNESKQQDVATALPAIKMVDYYEAMGEGIEGAVFETAHAMAVSSMELPLLDEALIGSWLESWGL